jgi:hypothetical protein
LGVRYTVFGTSSPRTRLSGGCSGNFRIVLIVSLAGSAPHLWRATVFAVFFPCFSSISFVFFFFGLLSARVLGVSHGFWVCWFFFWEGCSGFLVGFGGFVRLGCFRGLFGCLTRASTIFWVLGFMWVLLRMGQC